MSVYTDTTPKEANFRASMAKSPESQNRRPSQSNTVFCPDPSAHQTKDTSMQHYASKAALYKVDSPQNMREADVNPLGPDGKLSSASAATSLKYARAEDLPTYPIVGIEQKHSAGAAANLAHANPKSPEWWKPEQTNSAAGKAALLANANQKSPKYWKPEHSSAAGRAATLAAGNHKVAPVWKPEATAAGSKAALLAHRDATKTDPWSPSATSAGNSAANIAFGRQKPTHIPDNSSDRSSSLSAATGATSSSARARAKSSPAPPASYPDSANSARNSLSAATLAHRASMKATKAPIMDKKPGSGALEAARIQHAKTSREMYTEHPPVSTEVGEENHQNALRASAISMAKGMYDLSEQKRHDKEAGLAATAQGRTAATAAHDKKRFSSEADIKQQAQRYLHIQEAAQKLAAERLAKIGTDEDAAYRDYYGYNNSTKSKLLRGRRGRASSNPNPQDSDSDDEFRARRIRNQMSELNRGVAEVDAKRASDRRALLAAAERKVQAQMHGLDEKIFNETGKMSAAMIEEWDARARAKAAANSEARMANHGKVNIGGGKYIDQAEIDAVAAARVQPTLDEIAERTEKQRAKEEEMRLDREEAKRLAQIEKERAADLKAEEKRAKGASLLATVLMTWLTFCSGRKEDREVSYRRREGGCKTRTGGGKG
ncbi:hypothetical protein GQ43DRAFT_190534 [Delitschia confertaspora ATCC 74209]|uniref:Eisosome protein 1 n=1 Tax=Delitschia confertaspora ATCC 74209 TaxID=1513339 RepID=A0A9P4MP23_9PLEO|nr:hypothetical protein GQ43DRAFT_190534 [Delitschia confertaspora ATCC 74209]